MDDRLLILGLSALAIALQLWAMRLMIRADDAAVLEHHYAQLARSGRGAWDSWWAQHDYRVGKATLPR